MNKRETHIVTGLSKDLIPSKFDNKFVVDARNIRITAVNGNTTLLSVTNEKGTRAFPANGDIKGTILGHAVINKTLVLFTTEHVSPSMDGDDRIYRLDFNSNFTEASVTLLFEGDLNFYYENPLETLPYYENDSVQKVYWVDGRNQPRMIDITRGLQENPDVFNFNRKIVGKHILKVSKYNIGGQFPAGTVQYCFNYFNKFGQETNIVDVSPLYYLSPKDKGLPADGIDTSIFTITIENADPSYEYVRIYAILRTSENSTPNVRIVGDYRIGTAEALSNWETQNEPDIFDFDDLYIYDIDTLEQVYKVSTQYSEPEPSEIIHIPLSSNQVAFVGSSEYFYAGFGRSTNSRRNSITITNNGSGCNFVRNNQSTLIKKCHIIQATKSIVATDNGVVGSTIDMSTMLFIGGQDIIAGTIASKDNALFLGNIKQNVPNIGSIIVPSTEKTVKEDVFGLAESCVFDYNGNEKIEFVPTEEDGEHVSGNSFYSYPIDNNRSSYDTKSFKAREGYRLGIIAQYETGQWSEVLWVGDMDEEYAPGLNVFTRDENNNIVWGPSYRKPGFKLQLPKRIVNALMDNKFIRVAPVAVYPSYIDRKVLCQGILASTVYNVKDRYDDSPFAQADWRFRMGYNWDVINEEIQLTAGVPKPSIPAAFTFDNQERVNIDDADFVDYFSNNFYRDSNILTFHSPDIECSDMLGEADFANAKLRIVGISTGGFDSNSEALYPKTIKDSFIEHSAGFSTVLSKIIKEVQETDYDDSLLQSRFSDFTLGVVTTDYSVRSVPFKYSESQDRFIYVMPQLAAVDSLYDWLTYLWHRSGSLGGLNKLPDKAIKNGESVYGQLKKKCISELKFGVTTFFQGALEGDQSIFDYTLDTESIKMCDDANLSLIPLKHGNKQYNYYGNIDKVLVPSFKNTPEVFDANGESLQWDEAQYGYPIGFTHYLAYPHDSTEPMEESPEGMPHYAPITYRSDGVETHSLLMGTEPVSIKYKSSRHLIIPLKTEESDGVSTTKIHSLGFMNQAWQSPQETRHLYWRDEEETTIVFEDVIPNGTFGAYSGFDKGLYVAELYRDFGESIQRFGGVSDEAITNNVWTRCGDSVELVADDDAIIYYKEGDTYIGRYDCLKVYPFTEDDINQTVNIYSTEVEARVNLDERYDRMRGLTNNVFARPTTFNLFNHAGYEQSNQFFTYKAVDYDRYNFDSFPNLITWSLEKKAGADVDAWTSMHMLSTANIDGTLGEITKLATFNDSLFSFQPRGVAQILYNERVQIPTSDGQPIEITNGLKYGGYRYLSNQIGMINKWSLSTTPHGMYFIDDERNTLYHFNGQQFQDLSDKAGMRTWLEENNTYDVWNPIDQNNFRTWYDKVHGDLYFVNKDDALVFSEQIGNFISFMDYGGVPLMVNVDDVFLTSTINNSGKNTLWEMWKGDYNMFFGEFKPYWITFVANSDPTVDKVFNTLSWRTTDYDGDFLQPLRTFDTLRVWNDHQDSGPVDLVQIPNKPSQLKKKFNVFRALVPRDKFGEWAGKGMNRIRNTWTYIQLKRRMQNTDRMTFNDLEVDFFE